MAYGYTTAGQLWKSKMVPWKANSRAVDWGSNNCKKGGLQRRLLPGCYRVFTAVLGCVENSHSSCVYQFHPDAPAQGIVYFRYCIHMFNECGNFIGSGI